MRYFGLYEFESSHFSRKRNAGSASKLFFKSEKKYLCLTSFMTYKQGDCNSYFNNGS